MILLVPCVLLSVGYGVGYGLVAGGLDGNGLVVAWLCWLFGS